MPDGDNPTAFLRGSDGPGRVFEGRRGSAGAANVRSLPTGVFPADPRSFQPGSLLSGTRVQSGDAESVGAAESRRADPLHRAHGTRGPQEEAGISSQ